jgi:hypothetical protein
MPPAAPAAGSATDGTTTTTTTTDPADVPPGSGKGKEREAAHNRLLRALRDGKPLSPDLLLSAGLRPLSPLFARGGEAGKGVTVVEAGAGAEEEEEEEEMEME